ncbi:hypothetical protein CUJ91_31855 (plasmid) [Paraburkholderia graminis]|nr:hypothetical protein CUJ91_31855 [Paraburkholderia graminis]
MFLEDLLILHDHQRQIADAVLPRDLSDSIGATLHARTQEAGVILNSIVEIGHESTGFELAAPRLDDVIASRPILHRLAHEREIW